MASVIIPEEILDSEANKLLWFETNRHIILYVSPPRVFYRRF